MSAPNEITPNQLIRLLGTPEAPVVVDVRIDADFDDDPCLVPTAIRIPHRDLPAIQDAARGGKIVVTCQKGKKLSQGVVAWLRADGTDAEYLGGGNLGWRDSGMPCVPAAAVPARSEGATLWVTRHRPKIDRIACPWLIRRFVDPQARFLFVSPGEVADVADRFGATPFDIEGTFWSHRGDRCTFDTMVEEFALDLPALHSLAAVVRAADTNRHDLVPQAAGLLAISVGLSRQYRDDHQQLSAGMTLYDALYRWARDGQNEGHDWPASRG
ncbi:chromate resistance protein ChrB domain-containing protein [Candidatus Halocynthiibacter alkanivorans]|uniref:chromate resistance protein ChrB domain-containing protein n=1 Tax=Candidatus Halocynthiibacter alkanivorans TaxID=2267619 RepID=UPI000DF179BF|nr:sulfurtransferase/chromate resistance protein [Candidatus Halocynthiibacter alkanivorans]